jgi:hypothetical protein
MNTASIVLQLVSVGLLVYVLVKILEVEKSVEELKEESEILDSGTSGTGRINIPDLPDIFRPISNSPVKIKEEEVVELENDEDVEEDTDE